MTRGDAYYWAGGQKVALAADSRIAVDETRAREHGLWGGELSAAAESAGHTVGDGMVLLPAGSVSGPLRDQLDRTGASAPVYRADDSLIVVRPEVRMETAPATSASDVRTAIGRIDSDASVHEPKPGRFVVKPSSGRGADALELANRLAEELRPDVAQARFVRITPPRSAVD
jgi:hypothetical protein